MRGSPCGTVRSPRCDERREAGLVPGPDTGERAYDNVRKALRGVIKQLGKGGQAERAFAEHLRTHLRIGFEYLHSEPEGRIWS
jgi:hypothetical protein